MRRSLKVSGWVLAGLLAGGCQSLTGKTAGQTMDDTGLSAAVKTKLTAERASNFTRIDVDTHRGTVYLTGVVPSEEERRRAEELVKEIDGVEKIENDLQVEDGHARGQNPS